MKGDYTMGIYSRDEIERILKIYGDTIYRMAFIQVKNPDTADDIYQNVCMKLLKQKEPIEPEEHLKAWLLRTTIHCCKDYWKSSWIQRISWEEPSQQEETYEPMNEDQGPSYITECVQKLPEKYRAIIHLYYYEEYSGSTMFMVSSSLEVDEADIKTRFYFDKNDNLVYIKTIYGGKQELLKINLQKEAEDKLFEIPSHYAEN